MSKFLFLYKGPATPMEDYTPEQSAEQMQAWGAWMGKLGPALVDPGAPFGGVKASGIGRDGGDYSFDFYMETKNICLAHGTHRVPKLGA